MHITKLTLKNWMRYKGETNLELETKIYAIVAQTESNQDRSNWVGKSSLLEAIVFGLYGKKPTRFRLEDEWITNSENDGFVELTFDDGTIVKRSRTRGHSTKTEVTIENNTYRQTEAEERLEDKLGLSLNDFFGTCYFEQRQMAKFVLTNAQQRFSIVSDWLQLDKIIQASKLCKDTIKNQSNTINSLLGKLQGLRSQLIDEQKENENLSELNQLMVLLEKDIKELKSLIDTNRQDANDYLAKIKRNEIIRQGTELAKQLEEVNHHAYSSIEDEMNTLNRDIIRLRDLIKQHDRIALKGFDGHCPIINNQCPCSNELNANLNEHKELSLKYKKEVIPLEERYSALRSEYNRLKESERKQIQIEERLKSLREQANSLAESAKRVGDKEPVDIKVLQKELAEYEEEISNYKSQWAIGSHKIESNKILKSQIKEIEEQIKQLENQLSITQKTFTVLGRNGIQKHIAESAIIEIEEGANELLSESGLDLSVEISWSRDSQSLAKVCDSCGNDFPVSTRIKYCECGAIRGQSQISALDVVLSNRSGAAEDLAGCAIQLSAARWLRTNRETNWSTAILDECFGSLDVYNRKAFARHLISMLQGKYGFNQAFVISHSADTTHLFPGRIELMGLHDRTIAKVI